MFSKLPFKKTSWLGKIFYKPELYPEAFAAYRNRLPNQIKVDWFRDGNMIVGRVVAGDKEFVTQGRSADEFIQMITESVVTAFDIPEDYFDAVSAARSYMPPAAEIEKMHDKRITSRSYSWRQTSC